MTVRIETALQREPTCNTPSTLVAKSAPLSTITPVDDNNDKENGKEISFANVSMGTVDPDEILLRRIRADNTPGKINIMPGVYISEQGGYYEFEAIRKAKEILTQQQLGHDYISIFGIPELREGAQRLIFGENHPRVVKKQTIAGCGANRIGAAFLKHHFPSSFRYEEPSRNASKVYIGNPGWRNHVPLFLHAGFDVETYNYCDRSTYSVDFKSMTESLATAPRQSIFVVQVSCHNPSGMDLTKDQWKVVASIMRDRGHLPFFDLAYGGFGSGQPDGGYTDAWPIRYFAEHGMDFIVAQTFSKCMGLYGERVGCLHFVCSSQSIANKVLDQARCLARWEYSSPPAYAARLVGIVLSDTILRTSWMEELACASARIRSSRHRFHRLLVEKLRTPGDWSCILTGSGMFSFLPLSPDHIEFLAQNFHVWLPDNGRMNMAGLNAANIEPVAKAVDATIRELGSLKSESCG